MGKFIRYTTEQLRAACENSFSVTEVMRRLGYTRVASGSHSHLSKKIKELDIDISHFLGRASNRGKTFLHKRLKPEEIFNKKILIRLDSKLLTRALIESGVEYKCSKCGISDRYNNEELVLEVDHINSDWQNNTKENLRFLCPNCHSQETKKHTVKKIYTRKKRQYKSIRQPKLEYYCKCGATITRNGKGCLKCREQCHRIKTTKIQWPSPEELESMIWKEPTIQVSRKLGVSDNAVNKFCKKHNIKKPPKGFFLRKWPTAATG